MMRRAASNTSTSVIDADRHVGLGELAGALHQVGLVDPVMADAAAARRSRWPWSPGWCAPARPCQGWEEGQQQQEADVQRTHDRASTEAEAEVTSWKTENRIAL